MRLMSNELKVAGHFISKIEGVLGYGWYLHAVSDRQTYTFRTDLNPFSVLTEGLVRGVLELQTMCSINSSWRISYYTEGAVSPYLSVEGDSVSEAYEALLNIFETSDSESLKLWANVEF